MGEVSHAEPHGCTGRSTIGGNVIQPDIFVVVVRLTLSKDIKRDVFAALAGSDVEKNEADEVALHGETVSAWTSAIPGAPLKNAG